METPTKQRGRGFASLPSAERSRIASVGGKAAWQQGTAHRWTSQEAQVAGRKGGNANAAKRRKRIGFKEEL